MRRSSIVPIGMLLVALSGLGAACTSDSAQKPKPTPKAPTDNVLTRRGSFFNQQWAMDTLWEDGLAEVATYAAERVVYGEARKFEYTLITVKEEFNQQFNVKTDDYQRRDLFPVMKVNEFCAISTENYPYHFLTSLFFRRDQPTILHKMTTSSQEWCGNTFKAITDDGLQYAQIYNSYWDGQGAGHRQLRREVLFEDALPYTLRSLRFERKPNFVVPVYELQQTSQAKAPTLYQALFQTEDAQTETTSEPAWRVTVALDAQKKNVYWFAKRYPNTLLRQTTWDGRTLLLKEVRRYAYWPKKPAPSDTTAAATQPRM
ncbi:hypothetical protein SAMN06265337_1108 [Hymenobacter gelipurpurascens]|uniref:Septum formation inhibitor Maf n=1 Tax=Hymenobacter gelipurpurascens TaxID=89968 RepID=A0A212TFB7_9BACT|nr:hypothetical protein [Hymenobacter gelipurpurascens]SNC64580.1 hypothetical protein SAMN06265337_1108 [Hymenobacter gelipurpurascens]